MFARYLPLLARRGARITLACRPPLQPIFERVAGIDALLSPLPDQPLAKINLLQAQFDAWVPLLSLPFHLETGFATGPAEIPYLSIDPVRTVAWRERYETAGGRRDRLSRVDHGPRLSALALVPRPRSHAVVSDSKAVSPGRSA